MLKHQNIQLRSSVLRKGYKKAELKNANSSIDKFDNVLNYNKATIDSLLFSGVKGSYIGPIKINSCTMVYLIEHVVSNYKMRAGQILIDPINNSVSEVDSNAKEVLLKLKNGSSFNEMCKLFSFSDKSNYECDLGWFISGEMVKKFEQGVLDHKKDEVFRVETEFGTHIVKVLEDSIEQSRKVTYIEIKLY